MARSTPDITSWAPSQMEALVPRLTDPRVLWPNISAAVPAISGKGRPSIGGDVTLAGATPAWVRRPQVVRQRSARDEPTRRPARWGFPTTGMRRDAEGRSAREGPVA